MNIPNQKKTKQKTKKLKIKKKRKKNHLFVPETPPPSKFSLLNGKYLTFVLSSDIKVKHDDFVKYYVPVGNKVKKAILV